MWAILLLLPALRSAAADQVAANLYDRPAAVSSQRLSYGAALEAPNPVTAATLSQIPGVSAIHVDAAQAERGQISALVKAIRPSPTSIFGHFQSADDTSLKPKMDEGLLGAILDKAPNLKETLKFLRRLYVPPLGRRPVGPSDVTDYLADVQGFVSKNNAVMVGGVSIGDHAGVMNIRSIVKAKARGLRLIHVDSAGIARDYGVSEDSSFHRLAVMRIEEAALGADIALSGQAKSRAKAQALYARGYRHVILGSDGSAVDDAFSRFEDVPRDPARDPGPPPLSGNAVKSWLSTGKIATFGFLATPDVNLAKKMARGADGLWIDAEDGQFSLKGVQEAIAAAGGSPSVVRATEYNDPDIAAYLSAGAAGVIAPQVSTVWQAEEFIAAVKRVNPQAAAIVILENKRGLANVQDIAKVPGLDALFIGPHDLSLSMGLDKESPAFQQAIARIEAAARAAGVPLGGLASSRSQVYAMNARGYGLAATFTDQSAVAKRFKTALNAAGKR